ncbi:hypothetical protein ACQP06_27045 [Nocardia sp. CA-136227]|uniref:hypothetical protein n=1 Tax=Nocardia sp. CA-136227 TaxID=3239979 RepID=UPI003D992E48
MPTPGCLDGQVTAVSVDGNMLVAADRNGWIYSMDNLLSGPMLWNWTFSFGGPIWLWPGEQVPGTGDGPIASSRWAISHRMSKSFEDAKGYDHPTTAGLVELVALSQDGSRITYQDPWLPADLSYEIGGPMGGRFVSESLSVSGSVTFVMNRYGDMFTRKYDLDMAGSNHVREADPAGNPELARFVNGPLTGKPVFEVTVQATRSQLTVAPLGATLNRG